MAYDIFISYRRKGAGAGVAGELQAKLENRGYDVFLDVDDIGSGAFPMQIENAIKECNDFLLILSPGTLDRCSEESDWVRHEITLAEQHKKNIIGVALPGFVMPGADTLPLPLHDIPQKQVFLWSHEYRNASIEKIEENLVSRQKRKKRQRKTITLISALVAVAIAAIAVGQLIRPSVTPEPGEQEGPFIDTVQMMQDSFASMVYNGDNLLGMYPDPKTAEEYTAFMNGIACYDSALALSKAYPDIVFDTRSLVTKRDSLEELRKDKFNMNFQAAGFYNNFYNDSLSLVLSFFNNAKVLASEADRTRIDSLGRHIRQE